MARLPEVGGDSGNWGAILNEYLSESLHSDGSLKPNTVGAPQIKPGSITTSAIADGQVTNAKLANGSVSTSKLSDVGTANGLATLNGSGEIPDSQLPARLAQSTLTTSINTAVTTGQNSMVTSGTVSGDSLILTTQSGSTINAGNVRGAKGDTGEKGTTGDTGQPGVAGPAGAVGSMGPTGAAGPTGATGPTGSTGPAGSQGQTGQQGPPGDLADYYDLGTISSGTINLSTYAQGGVFRLTLSANVTAVTLPAVITGKQTVFEMIIAQDSTGSRTITWPSSIKSSFGFDAVLSTAANAVDVVAITRNAWGDQHRIIEQALS